MASETFFHIGRSQLHEFDQNSGLKVSRIRIGKAADFDFFYLNGHTVSGLSLDF